MSDQRHNLCGELRNLPAFRAASSAERRLFFCKWSVARVGLAERDRDRERVRDLESEREGGAREIDLASQIYEKDIKKPLNYQHIIKKEKEKEEQQQLLQVRKKGNPLLKNIHHVLHCWMHQLSNYVLHALRTYV